MSTEPTKRALPPAYTPGPWHLFHGKGYISIEYGTAPPPDLYCRPSRQFVAMVQFGRSGAKRGEPVRYHKLPADEANAHLIAAAPDLLSIARRWAALDGGAWFPERLALEKADLLVDTKRAIAKAEGR